MKNKKGADNVPWLTVVFILVGLILIILVLWLNRGSKIGFSGISKCVESYKGACDSASPQACTDSGGSVQWGTDCEAQTPKRYCCKHYDATY